MSEPKHYLSVDWNERKGKYLAVISEGHPNAGDSEVKICTIELFDKPKAARKWFKEQLEIKPWLPRN